MNHAVIAIDVLRIATGVFFLFSGYHKLFNAERRETLRQTFVDDHAPFIRYTMWLVPLGEFFGGMALIIGFLTPLASIGLIVILIGACLLDGWKRVDAWKPIDWADRVDDWLYLPEVLYILILVTIILAGPSQITVDYHLFGEWYYVEEG